MTHKEFYYIRDLEYWCGFYGIVVDLDASKLPPHLIFCRRTASGWRVAQKTIYPDTLIELGRNALTKQVYKIGDRFIEMLLCSDGF